MSIPYLVKGNKLKLVPGMTFSNEPGIYIYGEFGMRHRGLHETWVPVMTGCKEFTEHAATCC